MRGSYRNALAVSTTEAYLVELANLLPKVTAFPPKIDEHSKT